MSVGKDPHPPRLRRSSLSRARERVGVRAPFFKKYAKRAGMIALVLIALDLAAGAATMALGMEYLNR